VRKLFFVSTLVLAMTGCATQQESTPQVRDLSKSRERSPESHYTVAAGDTLYGIAWRHDMDYRDLAQLNQIGPPYRIQPGQQLRLRPDAGAAAQQDASGAGEARDGVVASATALGGAGSGQADGGDADWLLPDEEAIARNRRLTAEEDASDTAEAAAGGAATQEAAAASASEPSEAPAAASSGSNAAAEASGRKAFPTSPASSTAG